MRIPKWVATLAIVAATVALAVPTGAYVVANEGKHGASGGASHLPSVPNATTPAPLVPRPAGGGLTPAVVQSVVAANYYTGTASLPVMNTTPGDAIFILTGLGSSPSLSIYDNRGDAFTQIGTRSNEVVSAAFDIAGGSTNITVTNSGSATIVIVAVEVVGAEDGIDQVQIGGNITAGLAVGTAATNDLILSFYQASDNTGIESYTPVAPTSLVNSVGYVYASPSAMNGAVFQRNATAGQQTYSVKTGISGFTDDPFGVVTVAIAPASPALALTVGNTVDGSGTNTSSLTLSTITVSAKSALLVGAGWPIGYAVNTTVTGAPGITWRGTLGGGIGNGVSAWTADAVPAGSYTVTINTTGTVPTLDGFVMEVKSTWSLGAGFDSIGPAPGFMTSIGSGTATKVTSTYIAALGPPTVNVTSALDLVAAVDAATTSVSPGILPAAPADLTPPNTGIGSFVAIQGPAIGTHRFGITAGYPYAPTVPATMEPEFAANNSGASMTSLPLSFKPLGSPPATIGPPPATCNATAGVPATVAPVLTDPLVLKTMNAALSFPHLDAYVQTVRIEQCFMSSWNSSAPQAYYANVTAPSKVASLESAQIVANRTWINVTEACLGFLCYPNATYCDGAASPGQLPPSRLLNLPCASVEVASNPTSGTGTDYLYIHVTRIDSYLLEPSSYWYQPTTYEESSAPNVTAPTLATVAPTLGGSSANITHRLTAFSASVTLAVPYPSGQWDAASTQVREYSNRSYQITDFALTLREVIVSWTNAITLQNVTVDVRGQPATGTFGSGNVTGPSAITLAALNVSSGPAGIEYATATWKNGNAVPFTGAVTITGPWTVTALDTNVTFNAQPVDSLYATAYVTVLPGQANVSAQGTLVVVVSFVPGSAFNVRQTVVVIGHVGLNWADLTGLSGVGLGIAAYAVRREGQEGKALIAATGIVLTAFFVLFILLGL